MNYDKVDSSLLARNSVLNFVGQLIPLAFGIFAIPIIIKGLGIAGFGVLSLSWLLIGYFSIFDLGLSKATTKSISESIGKGNTESVPTIIWTTVAVQFLLAIIGMILFVIAIPFLVNNVFKIPESLLQETTDAFYIMAYSLPIVLLSINLRGVLEAYQRFDLINYIKIPASSLMFILPAIAVGYHFGLAQIVALLVAVRFLSLIVFVLFCIRNVPSILKQVHIELKVLRSLLNYGVWITVSAVIGPVYNYIERIFIVSILGAKMLGLYSPPYEMISRITVFPNSLAMTLFPAFSHYEANNSTKIDELFLRPLKYLIVILTPISVILYVYAGGILNMWLGAEFAQNSMVVFQILVVAFFLNSLAAIAYVSIQGLGRADIKAKFDMFEVVIFVGLVWIFVKLMGITGAALAKLVITIIDVSLLMYASNKLIGFSKESFYRSKIFRSLIICLIYILSAFVIVCFFNGTARMIVMFIAVLIYSVIMWVMVIDDKDKGTIAGMVSKWRKR
ncbi:flippase [bacterium]|nr:flippase [bacterium]